MKQKFFIFVKLLVMVSIGGIITKVRPGGVFSPDTNTLLSLGYHCLYILCVCDLS